MQDPKITIIVPAYNIENYISKCLLSIQKQTYNNIEVIVINDGSTDNTLNVIQNTIHNDKRFLVVNQKNLGVSIARQKGIEISTGEYIGFVDGDDVIEPDMFEHLISNARKYKADISHCGHIVVSEDKQRSFYGTGKIVEQNTHSGLKDLLDGTFVEPGLCNKLYKNILFDNIDYAELSEIKNNEDLLLNFFLFSKSKKSIYEDFCPYYYIQRNGSATNAKLNKHQLFDPLRVITIIANVVSENKELYSIAYSRKIRQYIRISTAEVKDNPELKKECIQTHKQFKKMILQIISSNYCSLKLKLMSLWVTFAPCTYGIVHSIHNKLKYQ